MAPKVQPRRQQPARSGSNSIREDESKPTLSEPSAKESFVEESNTTPDIDMETNPTRATESHTSDSQPEARSTPAATAGSPAPRRPVQRLASVMHGRSSTPRANADGETRPVALKFKPKSFIRRSKEERDAVEKAEAERRAARETAEGTASTIERRGHHGRGRGRGGGFGDMNRWKNERFNLSGAASGHLGGSTIKESSTSRGGRGGSNAGGAGRSDNKGSSESVAAASTRSGTRVKRESTVKSEKDKDGDVLMTSSTSTNKRKRPKMKNEDQAPAYVSSEGEFDSDGAERVDIEHINLITDDEDTDNDLAEQSDIVKGKQRQQEPPLRRDPLRPVRIQRQEHVERAVGVNTDASSLTSAELRRRAKERNEAEGSLFLPDEEKKTGSQGPRMKGRRKPKDVEFVRNERKWKGVYEDEDDKADNVKIKNERNDDDDVMAIDVAPEAMDVDEEPVPLNEAMHEALPSLSETAKTIGEIENSSQTLLDEDIEHPEDERARAGDHGEPGVRRRSEEWVEDYEDLITEIEEIYALLDDFESKSTPSTKVRDNDGANDLDQEADMFSGDGHPSFIFQIPPTVPSLRDPTRKPASQAKAKPTLSETPKITNPFATPIKEDPETKTNLGAPGTQTTVLNTYTHNGLNYPAGRTGALTVHRGGKMSVDWGGQGMKVIKERGDLPATMPQEMIMTKYVREIVKREDDGAWEERVEVGEKGWSMGTVKPGCICRPVIGDLLPWD